METNASSTSSPLRVTLISNAGLLLQYQGITLMMDGIYGREGHPFSNLSRDVWSEMLHGDSPFERIDYLLFSHAHPDHFSPEMTCEFLRHRRVKGIFFPDDPLVTRSGLVDQLKRSGTPSVALSTLSDHASFQIEPGISVRAFSTRHLDKKFWDVRHFCYVLTFGEKKLLFTADADYTYETFSEFSSVPLRSVFVNPLFFNALQKKKFFHGSFQTQSYCIYHVPFSEDDSLRMRPILAHEMVEWPSEKPEAAVLCDAFQHIEL